MSDEVGVKFCGLRTERDVDTACTLRAAMIGLVSCAASARHLENSQLIALANYARCHRPTGCCEVVLLTVDCIHTPACLALIDTIKPEVVQCHGRETLAQIQALRRSWSGRVIKSVGIADDDPQTWKDAAMNIRQLQRADVTVLIDRIPPHTPDAPATAATLHGGHGVEASTEGLNTLRPLLQNAAWMLAGGLTPTNVCAKVRHLRPRWVDVSSGVERIRGVKHHPSMRAFAEAVASCV